MGSYRCAGIRSFISHEGHLCLSNATWSLKMPPPSTDRPRAQPRMRKVPDMRTVCALPPLSQAIAAYEKCIELAPDSRNASQNRLLGLNYIYPGEDRFVCQAHEVRPLLSPHTPSPTSTSVPVLLLLINIIRQVMIYGYGRVQGFRVLKILNS